MKIHVFFVSTLLAIPLSVLAGESSVKDGELERLIDACVRHEKYSREMSQIANSDVMSTARRRPADKRSDQEIVDYCKKDVPEKEKLRIKTNAENEERKRAQEEIDAKNRLIQEKENIFAEAERLKKASFKEQRAQDLKNRKVSPSTIGEAMVFYDAADGGDIVIHPPIVEDNGKYAVKGLIENLLDGVLVFNGGSPRNPIYFFAVIDESTKYIPGFVPRINSTAQLVGEFVGLRNFTTTSGQSKVAPVFKVVIMGK